MLICSASSLNKECVIHSFCVAILSDFSPILKYGIGVPGEPSVNHPTFDLSSGVDLEVVSSSPVFGAEVT